MEHDYVIVGAGAAGCVLASRLSEDRGVSVLLLESGAPYSERSLATPLMSLRSGQKHTTTFFTEEQEHLNHRRLQWRMGHIVGGGTSINAMIYIRGNRADYDQWESLGNRGWGYEGALPFFKRAEDQERGASAYHGAGGPLAVSDIRHRAVFSELFVEACAQIGIPRNDDFNGPSQEGAGFHQVTQRNGRRAGQALAYLNPALARKNLEVITGAPCTRILVEKGRAVGVELRRGGERTRAMARREVIVCAGAIKSPQLLMLSGIGPADHLRQHGIPVVLDLPGVGRNLQDHLRLPVVYELKGEPPFSSARSVAGGLLDFLLRGRGLLTSNVCEAGAFIKHGESSAPSIQFVSHWSGRVHGWVDFEPCLIQTGSRGTITLRSADPGEPPKIDPSYLSDSRDLEILTEGIRLARAIAAAPAFRGSIGREMTPGHDITAEEGLRRYVRNGVESSYHAAGSCKMGHDREAVVSDDLKVHGVEGLRVADASIMPVNVSGNTAAPTTMIAEKAAAIVRGGSAHHF
jgi:choline dehydrogenase